MDLAYALLDRGLLPDGAIRFGIRRLLRRRLREIEAAGDQAAEARARQVTAAMEQSPIALAVDLANEQHYEVPADFFLEVLGRHLKYSSCLWEPGVDALDQAEQAMLRLTCERAELADGQRILELGCGWGSLSLWMAERYPGSSVLAVSNSHGQRRFIEARGRQRGLDNLQVVTADMNDFTTEGRFDRVVSVEMFEHMRNWRELFGRIDGWLEPEGRFFLHVFCHRRRPYFFEASGPTDWMARHFFTGGLMPSFDLPDAFDDRLVVEERWAVNGLHYQRTLEAWLAELDRRHEKVLEIFEPVYGAGEAARWVRRWRAFFMACSELFGYRRGEEWLVGHYLLKPRGAA
jgi:cyclopropane-fatty-acyl-phospholipid synthase